MNDVVLPALEGTNPLGFFAALGVLDALSASFAGITLRWTDELVPCAVIGGVDGADSILDTLDSEREKWPASVTLGFPQEAPLSDAKPEATQLRQWMEAVFHGAVNRVDADLICALVAEGAFDRNKKAKPTHLHFTAGQQQFLDMVRTLISEVKRDRLHEAIFGPWAYDSSLPSLSWDARGERVYAIRASNPSKEARLGVPGADWLAFRGLVFYPVTRTAGGSLRTAGCDGPWKQGAFRWPLWSVPATRDVVRSLVADQSLVGQHARLQPDILGPRGLFAVLRSPIRRNDQGGYGSFGAPEVLASFVEETP
jgi:hypothetical protein